MSNISTDNDIFAGLGLVQQEQEQPQNTLVMGDFLELMVTELTHQDPFKPMDNTELASQMSQFATVSGIGDLNREFASLSASLTSDQTLQAANLVGRDVLVPVSAGYLKTGSTLSGAVKLDSNVSNLALRVTDAAGALVREIELGTQLAGDLDFTWDGITDLGDFAPQGQYQVTAVAEINGETAAPATLISAKVDSVSVRGAGQGVALNLEGLGLPSR